MEVSFALWSLRNVIEKIPFDLPVAEEAVHLDFSDLAVPYYVKNGFKVSIIFVDDTFPADATCSIYSPKKVVTVIFIIKRKFEENLRSWIDTHDEQYLDKCCRRRELYCHEVSHLIAIVRAFPSDRSSRVREDFIEKLQSKFEKSMADAQNSRAIPFGSGAVSVEQPGESPSIFHKDHFRYANDSLNYFRLYQELMFPYDKMVDVITKLAENPEQVKKLTYEDIKREAFVSKKFFDIYSEKLSTLRELLAEKLS